MADAKFGPVTIEDYQQRARNIVEAYVLAHLDKSDPPVEFQVYVVWFSKTLQNWKALVSTTLPDQKYYELTYNGDKKETYVDVYLKVDNTKVADEEWPFSPRPVA